MERKWSIIGGSNEEVLYNEQAPTILFSPAYFKIRYVRGISLFLILTFLFISIRIDFLPRVKWN